MLRALLLASVVPLALAPAAFGATVTTSRVNDSDSGPPASWTYTVHVNDTRGERNALTVEPVTSGVVVRDRAARLRERSRRCRSIGAHAVRCSVGDTLDLRLGAKDDRLHVFTENDSDRHPIPDPVVYAGGGDDRILLAYGGSASGEGGDDVFRARDRPFARAAHFFGGAGRDRIFGGRGRDLLDGGPGDDVVHGLAGADHVSGGTGRDTLAGGSASDRLDDGDLGFRTRTRRFIGPDTIVGGTGADTVLSYMARRRPVFVDLNRPGGDGERGERDSLSRVEHIWSGAGDDRLIGDGDGNNLIGGPGADVLRGRGGRDRLDALDGDTATGDLGADEIRTVGWTTPAVECGDGEDRVTYEPRLANAPRRPPVSPYPGIVIPADCERLRGRYTDAEGFIRRLEIDPVPAGMTANGDMMLDVFVPTAGGYTLDLTRATAPFEQLDSAPLDSERVTVTAPADVAQSAAEGPVTLRFEALADQLVWRFAVRRQPAAAVRMRRG